MKDVVRLVLVLTVIAAGAGLILSGVEGVTREPIAKQRRLEMLRALRAVLPPMDNEPDKDTVSLVTGTNRKGKEESRIFYRGRQGTKLTGVAFKVVGTEGYAGNIEIMVGVRPDGTVNGIEILSQAETPGLGARITEPKFKDQFRGKNLENADWKVKKDGGDFDQITGATISPRAVVKAIRMGLEFYKEHQGQITAPKRSEG
jgi:electron transport complex protein RnfG